MYKAPAERLFLFITPTILPRFRYSCLYRFLSSLLTFLVRIGERGPDDKTAKTVEHRLLQDTVYSSSYNREVRPVLKETDVVNVSFSMTLVQIVDVVSYAKLLSVLVWHDVEYVFQEC